MSALKEGNGSGASAKVSKPAASFTLKPQDSPALSQKSLKSEKRIKRLEKKIAKNGGEVKDQESKKGMLKSMKIASQLTDDQLLEYRGIFQFFDKDGNGTIDSAELGAALRALGENPSEEQLKNLLKEVDEDGSGTIDYFEFLTLMVHRSSEENRENDIRQAFKLFDTDGNGTISAVEFRRTMTTLGEPMSNADVDEMMSVIDVDGDGQIDYEEFLKLILPGIETNGNSNNENNSITEGGGSSSEA